MFLRQVDDFAIDTPNKELADSFLDITCGHLKQKLKHQGILPSFNELDVRQTSHCAKMSCQTCLTKILKGHG